MKGHLEELRQQVSFITWLPQTSQAHRLVTPASHASLIIRFPFLLLFLPGILLGSPSSLSLPLLSLPSLPLSFFRPPSMLSPYLHALHFTVF